MAISSLKKTYSTETFNLLNPAFCGLILMSTAQSFYANCGMGMPISLCYLALPLVLHERTRKLIGKQKNLAVWIKENQEILVGFSDRASALVPFVSASLDFLFRVKSVRTSKGKIIILHPLKVNDVISFSEDEEIRDCVKKATSLGKLFSKIPSDVDIYAALGVKP
jgi:hypothetical protein